MKKKTVREIQHERVAATAAAAATAATNRQNKNSDDGDTVCLIHIRRWYLYNDKHKPGKDGIALNLKSWQQLKEFMTTNKEEQTKTFHPTRTTPTTEKSCDESNKMKAESDNEMMEAATKYIMIEWTERL